MKISNQNNAYIISFENDNTLHIISKIEGLYQNKSNSNLIFDFSETVKMDEELFKYFTDKMAQHPVSMVLIYLNHLTDDEHVNIVPTLQEALDIVELETIERDLGI